MKRLAVITAPILLAALTACGGSKEIDEKANQQDATDSCHEWAKNQLKSPSSAKFSGDHVTGTDGVYVITGAVDSDNSFGAPIRSTWKCSIHPDGDTWRGSVNLLDGGDTGSVDDGSSSGN